MSIQTNSEREKLPALTDAPASGDTSPSLKVSALQRTAEDFVASRITSVAHAVSAPIPAPGKKCIEKIEVAADLTFAGRYRPEIAATIRSRISLCSRLSFIPRSDEYRALR